MEVISTGTHSVPQALKALQTAETDLGYVSVEIDKLDPGVSALGGQLRDASARVERIRRALDEACRRSAQAHQRILAAAGECTQADIDGLNEVLGALEEIDDGRFGVKDFLGDLGAGIVDFSITYNSFFGALGTWAAGNGKGSFADTYRQTRKDIEDDVAPVKGIAVASTSLVVGVYLKTVNTAVDLAKTPESFRKSYDASDCATNEGRLMSAGMASAVLVGLGKSQGAVTGKIPGKWAKAAVGKLISSGTAQEKELFARGVGEMMGAMVDAGHGSEETAGEVFRRMREGVYGETLQELAERGFEDLDDVLAGLSDAEVKVVHDRPAGLPSF